MEKSPFGASLLAWLVVAKFARHLPVYRHQEILLGPLKLWLSRTLLCGLLRGTAEALRPLEARIREYVLASALLQVDETPVRFLGKILGRAALGYIWAYAGDDQHPYVFYDFQPSRSRDGPEKILAELRGLSADRRLRGLHRAWCATRTAECATQRAGLTVAAAWTKRATRPVIRSCTRRWPGSSSSTTSKTRRANLSPDERLAVRLRESAPIVERMRQRFLDVRPELRPTSKLAEAIDYFLNRWEALYPVPRRWPHSAGHQPALNACCVPSLSGRKEFLVLWKPERRPHGGDALHDRAKRPAEQRRRAAVPDRCASQAPGDHGRRCAA